MGLPNLFLCVACVGDSQGAAVVGLRRRVYEGEAPVRVCGLGEVIVGY